MFEKRRIKKQIEASKQRIEMLEQKRTRSQAALLEAILKNATPDDEDVDYFNKFTEEIEAERNFMHELMRDLQELENKKKK